MQAPAPLIFVISNKTHDDDCYGDDGRWRWCLCANRKLLLFRKFANSRWCSVNVKREMRGNGDGKCIRMCVLINWSDAHMLFGQFNISLIEKLKLKKTVYHSCIYRVSMDLSPIRTMISAAKILQRDKRFDVFRIIYFVDGVMWIFYRFEK